MNLILEIWKMVIKEIQSLHLWILLYFAYLLTILQVTYQTDSKILKGTPNNTQVTPITRPPFLFGPYLLDLFFHMFTFQRRLFTFLVQSRLYHQL